LVRVGILAASALLTAGIGLRANSPRIAEWFNHRGEKHYYARKLQRALSNYQNAIALNHNSKRLNQFGWFLLSSLNFCFWAFAGLLLAIAFILLTANPMWAIAFFIADKGCQPPNPRSLDWQTRNCCVGQFSISNGNLYHVRIIAYDKRGECKDD
jgi:hypothetical protein